MLEDVWRDLVAVAVANVVVIEATVVNGRHKLDTQMIQLNRKNKIKPAASSRNFTTIIN